MDGEFDREVDDDGWGPLSLQAEWILKGIGKEDGVVVTAKGREKYADMLQELIEGRENERSSLGDLIWARGKEELAKGEAARKKAALGSILLRRKYKQAVKKHFRRLARWQTLGVAHRGTEHLTNVNKAAEKGLTGITPTPNTDMRLFKSAHTHSKTQKDTPTNTKGATPAPPPPATPPSILPPPTAERTNPFSGLHPSAPPPTAPPPKAPPRPPPYHSAQSGFHRKKLSPTNPFVSTSLYPVININEGHLKIDIPPTMMPQQPDPSLTSHIPGHKAPSMASRTSGTTTIDLSDYEDREGNNTYRDMDEDSDSEAEDSEEEEEEDQLDAPFGDRQARFLSEFKKELQFKSLPTPDSLPAPEPQQRSTPRGQDKTVIPSPNRGPQSPQSLPCTAQLTVRGTYDPNPTKSTLNKILQDTLDVTGAELMRSRVEEELRQEVRDEMLSTMRDEMQRTTRGSTVNYTDNTDASEAMARPTATLEEQQRMTNEKRVSAPLSHHHFTRSKAMLPPAYPDAATAHHSSSAFPLVESSGGHKIYKPFAVSDTQTISDKLPPISEGGNLWLDKLDCLTKGQDLALGDFRAILALCVTPTELRDIETCAGTISCNDDRQLVTVIRALRNELRSKYPLPNGPMIPKFSWDKSLSPSEYLAQCKEQWSKCTGVHPSKGQEHWFRDAVIKGVPADVREHLENSPDLPGSTCLVWERHLKHHLQRAKDRADKEGDDDKDMQRQLMKLQLTQARRNITEGKKDRNTDKIMIAAASNDPQISPDMYPVPQRADCSPYSPPTDQSQGSWGRGRGARSGGPYRGGGFQGNRRFRNNGPPRQGGYWNQAQTAPTRNNACHSCGMNGHWWRECPNYPPNPPQQHSYPMRGMARGPPPLRQGGPPPQQQQQQQAHQFPVAVTAWDQTWEAQDAYQYPQ
ncbi:uncharacterized protein LOC125008963 [Xyrichtys novacula]|uniref:Uncharacterized protein LOC125008963 n=1 Tax=Xyrichtys novacula TaxID=13765 RepID=A0AAV1GZD3_XYRNO|nr:uncharacterized protein LOC125008963 [Xyrichtys novacula]